ncbi:hypothetical protein SLE2022_381810 [Rubroshorea leprosula]
MARLTMGMAFVAVVAAVVLVQSAAAQTVHVVGDSIGWRVPSNGAQAYTNWAAQRTFVVGDTLMFNFQTNQHDVLQVPKASFDACSSSNPIGNKFTTGPANITLDSAGEHYYICTIGQHCQGGQKLAITVSTSSSGSPTPAPPTNMTPPTTPSPSSGTPADCAPAPATGRTPAGSPTPTSPDSNRDSVLPSSTSAIFVSLWLSILGIAMGFVF